MAAPTHATPQGLDDSDEETERNDYIKRFIEFRPGDHGPDGARISETGVSVAAVITTIRGSGGDLTLTAAESDLSRDALITALVYFACRSEFINARILLNNAGFVDFEQRRGTPLPRRGRDGQRSRVAPAGGTRRAHDRRGRTAGRQRRRTTPLCNRGRSGLGDA